MKSQVFWERESDKVRDVDAALSQARARLA
jgi:hypothetical protein